MNEPEWYECDNDLAGIRVVATDMDCTLLADDGTMPPDMPALIDALDGLGITFCAASGRPGYTLEDMFADRLDRMALISDNGAGVVCRGERVYSDRIEPARYHELIDFTLADGRGCPTVCGIEACFILERDRVFDAFFRRFYKKIVYLERFEGLDAEVNKYTVCFPDGIAEDVYREAYRDAWGAAFTVTNAGREWIDLMNRGVDKGSGLARLCGHVGCTPAEAMVFGDTYNDIPMLRVAGHGVIVANAEDHMRAHARYVAPSNNDRGVARVLERLIDLRS